MRLGIFFLKEAMCALINMINLQMDKSNLWGRGLGGEFALSLLCCITIFPPDCINHAHVP